jgi:hypothetical protein
VLTALMGASGAGKTVGGQKGGLLAILLDRGLND